MRPRGRGQLGGGSGTYRRLDEVLGAGMSQRTRRPYLDVQCQTLIVVLYLNLDVWLGVKWRGWKRAVRFRARSGNGGGGWDEGTWSEDAGGPVVDERGRMFFGGERKRNRFGAG